MQFSLIYLEMSAFSKGIVCEIIPDATQTKTTDLLTWRAHKDPTGHKPVTRCHGFPAELGWTGGQRSDIVAG